VAIELNYTAEDHIFLGTDKIFEYEIFADDGIDEDLADGSPNPLKTMVDASTLEFAWAMAKTVKGSPVFPAKRTAPAGTGITVVGVYASGRVANTQRVRVTISDEDTDALKEASYYYGFKRMSDGAEEILTFGKVPWRKNPAPAE
jgi:hypothetical protein